MPTIIYMPCDVEEQADGIDEYTVEAIIKFFWGEDALVLGLAELAQSTDNDHTAAELVLKPTTLCDVVTHFDEDGAHKFLLLPKGAITKEEWLKLDLPRIRYDG